MKKRTHQNKEVHRIGDKVLKAVRLADEDIDRIVASPQLFNSIRAAIESGRTEAKPAIVPAAWPDFLENLGWQRSLTGFAVAATIAAGSIGLIIFATQDHGLTDVASEIKEQALPVEDPPPPTADLFQRQTNPDAGSVSIRRRPRRKGVRAAEPRSVKRPTRQPEETMGEFQAVTYAGDAGDESGQIVRVELPRASLFAMGIDIPVENETAKVKTDLLIGSDGVMRAVRVVRTN